MGKENNNVRNGGISRNMESLRAMADMMSNDVLKTNDDNSQFSDKPDEKAEKTPAKNSSVSRGKGNEISQLVKCIETITDNEDTNGYTSCRVRFSVIELLDELKSIPEFRGYNKGDILGAALYLFVEKNRETLREKKSNRFSSL